MLLFVLPLGLTGPTLLLRYCITVGDSSKWRENNIMRGT